MNFFIKKIFDGEVDDSCHKYFLRFGKGNYNRRFLISFNKTKRLKIKSSFELANDFVEFVKENKDVKFSGKVLTKSAVSGMRGRKKAGSFVYEVSDSSLDQFEDVYFYLLDVNDGDVIMKIKKKIPKPGKSEGKIDDKFCALDLDLKYWDKVREVFFWDIPADAKKVVIEHEVVITDIVMPSDVDDPVKVRELAKRKGKIIRRAVIDGEEKVSEVKFEA